jgi:glycosyltransferase involved in cell wall biosynthesis
MQLRDRPTTRVPRSQLKPDLNLSNRIAVLITPEYEGIFRNGGIGTYYHTLSQKLAENGWSVLLLLYQTEGEFLGRSLNPSVRHAFSTNEIDRVLDLAPHHSQRLQQFQPWDWVEASSYRSLLFVQALSDRYPTAQIYIEFPDLCGVGLQTIRAKRAGLLGQHCTTAVTLHSPQEWLNEADSRFSFEHSNWFRRVYEYEREAFESADLPFFLSYALRDRLVSYGWNLDRALYLPYCFKRLDPNRPPSAPLNLPRHIIPIVFFGRLEQRKGLLTFLAALHHLQPAQREQLHIVFLGKSVELNTPDGESLTSCETIERELGQEFTYSLETDRDSDEAIALVRSLAPAIVCLTSPQENLPNTAFEMAQLPVSLVVSDAGGFREPLNLVGRTDGVRWFEPGSVVALARQLGGAISAYPECPTVPKQDNLKKLNAALMQAKLSQMERRFDSNVLDHLESAKNPQLHVLRTRVLGMTCDAEQEFLGNYARYEYSGEGEFVDLGCWLGSASICFAQGLEQNNRVALKHKRIHAYDLFIWESTYMERSVENTKFAGRYQHGESFFDGFLELTQPWSDLIEVRAGDLTKLTWNRGSIEYLFIDAMKTWELSCNILRNFFPSLVPGKSLIHHNDFTDSWSAWIHLITYRLRSYFTHRDSLLNAAVFDYHRAIPLSVIEELSSCRLSLDCFSRQEINAAFDYSLDFVDPAMKHNIVAAKAMLFVHLRDFEMAQQVLNQGRDRFGEIGEIPVVQERISAFAKFMQ